MTTDVILGKWRIKSQKGKWHTGNAWLIMDRLLTKHHYEKKHIGMRQVNQYYEEYNLYYQFRLERFRNQLTNENINV
jgi:hypothetical protein